MRRPDLRPVSHRHSSNGHVYDLIGVGFGPSNIALAIALEEKLGRAELRPRCLFLETQQTSAWHPGMMLPGTTLQVSFLKDLVTLRDPTSRYTFLNYVKDQGRIDEFINLRTFFPSRREFAGYIEWVAAQFEDLVRYGNGVRRVSPVTGGDGRIDGLVVETYSGKTYETRQLVVASGGEPLIPVIFNQAMGPKVFHSSEFLTRVPGRQKLSGERVAVVGSGQSAAEIVYHLATQAKDIEISFLIRDFSLRPMDDSKFVNEVFFPRVADFSYGLSRARREEFFQSMRLANYSAVDVDLISQLYGLIYEGMVEGERKVRFVTHAEIEQVRTANRVVTLSWRNYMTEESGELEADFVVLATGLRHTGLPFYLKPLRDLLVRDGDDPLVERNYQLRFKDGGQTAVYVQGFAEDSHGISDTLLSMCAHRAGVIAGEIAKSLRAKTASDDSLDRAAPKSDIAGLVK